MRGVPVIAMIDESAMADCRDILEALAWTCPSTGSQLGTGVKPCWSPERGECQLIWAEKAYPDNKRKAATFTDYNQKCPCVCHKEEKWNPWMP